MRGLGLCVGASGHPRRLSRDGGSLLPEGYVQPSFWGQQGCCLWVLGAGDPGDAHGRLCLRGEPQACPHVACLWVEVSRSAQQIPVVRGEAGTTQRGLPGPSWPSGTLVSRCLISPG